MSIQTLREQRAAKALTLTVRRDGDLAEIQIPVARIRERACGEAADVVDEE